jgi:hypothetical protein
MSGFEMTWDALSEGERAKVLAAAGFVYPPALVAFNWQELNPRIQWELSKVDWFKVLGKDRCW